MTLQKQKRPALKSKLGNKFSQNHYNDTLSQCNRILDRLKITPVSMIDARRDLNIMHSAGRISKLRHKFGYNIITTYIEQEMGDGRTHRVALYHLMPGTYKKGGAK